MGVLEKIREMQEAAKRLEEPLRRAEPVEIVIPTVVDVEIARKAGVLAAFGLQERDIVDALLLSHEQMVAAKGMPEYKESYSRQLSQRAQRAVDLEEGWDTVEERAVAVVLETLAHQRDPKFALHAAYIANKAVRRNPAMVGRVIDASKVGNTIQITLNKTFINNSVNGEGATVNIQQNSSPKVLPKRNADVLSPMQVSKLLGVQTKAELVNELDNLLTQTQRLGVVPDLVEGEGE